MVDGASGAVPQAAHAAGGTGRLKAVARVLRLTLVLNALVAVAKLVVGFGAGSLALVADGLHSVSDSTSNILGLIALRVASQPPDADHPYGHEKFETFGAAAVAVLLFLGCWEIGKQAVARVFSPLEVHIGSIGFWVVGVTMLINLFTAIYERRKGRILHSELLIADSMHTHMDVWISASVLVSLALGRLGYPVLDVVLALGISGVLAFASFRILWQNVTILADTSILDPRKVIEVVRRVPAVTGCHKIRTRGRPHHIFMDLHIQVERDTDTTQSHFIVHDLQDRLRTAFPGLADIVIHTEPSDVGSGFSGDSI